jgi:tetratricopeptide (TPR) repeat protein
LRILLNIVALLAIVFLYACSAERNTWTSKAYHNTTAHYNGYYYAREELKNFEIRLWESMQDDHNRILRLFPGVDSSLAKANEKELEEAIKMASIAIQRHPNSHWVDDCYLLVGQARLYSLDWGNAIQTYKFVNTKSKDPDARHRAIIGLIRTFTEHREYNNGQAAIDYLQKQKLNKTNRKNFALAKAYFYQEQGNLDYMVRSLAQAENLLRKKDKPGRIYFIIGQVYQKLGFESEAYQFYKKSIATNPEYEIDFYARLYMAQVTEISRSRNVAAARKSFRKLLKDGKNKDFQDKIYYEMGMFELKQKNLNEALAHFNRAVRAGKSRQIDGEAYLRLGEIYYDTLRQYALSQAYYDSAINSLSPDYENYAEVKARQEVLDEFVTNLNIIQYQDSLLKLASLDSAAIYKIIDSTYQEKRRLAELEAKKKKKRSGRVQIVSNRAADVFGLDSEDGAPIASQESGDWYFYNPSAMSMGQSEFRRVWGDIQPEDNWRRSQRSVSSSISRRPTNTPVQGNTSGAETPEATPADPVAIEFNRLNTQIPRTEEQKKAALSKIEEAYFKVADIYNFKLFETNNAVASYTTLLNRFPDSQFEAEVLYRLYLIYKETDPARSEEYGQRLKTGHPGSTFAKILVNPNYLEESSQALREQESFYKTAYEQYQEGRFNASLGTLDKAMDIGSTSFTPQLELLRILIAGRTEDVAVYQYQLDQFVKKYPDTPTGNYAKKLLETSQEFLKDQEKRKGIQYIRSFEEPHYFVMVYKKTENMGNKPTLALEKFNSLYFGELKLKTSNLVLSDDYTITLVADLPRVTSAIEYVHTFRDKLSTLTELRNYKFHNFVITKDNFDIFYRTKGLDEYIYFFEKNYPLENP